MIAAVSPDEAAFSHRDALVEFVARASWSDEEQDQSRIAMARRYSAAIEPFASCAYVNDLTEEGEAEVQTAYGSTNLKARYNPDNVFHLNYNVKP